MLCFHACAKKLLLCRSGMVERNIANMDHREKIAKVITRYVMRPLLHWLSILFFLWGLSVGNVGNNVSLCHCCGTGLGEDTDPNNHHQRGKWRDGRDKGKARRFDLVSRKKRTASQSAMGCKSKSHHRYVGFLTTSACPVEERGSRQRERRMGWCSGLCQVRVLKASHTRETDREGQMPLHLYTRLIFHVPCQRRADRRLCAAMPLDDGE